jgi:hypothetical protein
MAILGSSGRSEAVTSMKSLTCLKEGRCSDGRERWFRGMFFILISKLSCHYNVNEPLSVKYVTRNSAFNGDIHGNPEP